MNKKYHLYFDDTGSRRPDHKPDVNRKDSMDCFGYGGILIAEDDISELLDKHREFLEQWPQVTIPLHSTKIRGRRREFSWLGKDKELEQRFLAELEEFILSLPIVSIACVIDRPGYVARYSEKYDGNPWQMNKTALCILVERAAKFAKTHDAQLELYFEQSGKVEDEEIKQYVRELKKGGAPFNSTTSSIYAPFSAHDYKSIILGEPRERTKKTPMIQLADLVLYPMAKAGYDPEYKPYVELMAAGKIIDASLSEEDKPSLGVKYSCFDFSK